jgi:hypothetical protein
VAELIEAYECGATLKRPAIDQSHPGKFYDTKLHESFVSVVFEWMTLPETSPVAGKLLVTLFQKIRTDLSLPDVEKYSTLWQRWIHYGLAKHPDSLENIKNHLFPPLFKLDRTGSLEFLQDLAKQNSMGGLNNSDLDAQAFLLLSAMEVGKKSGLVDELGKKLGGVSKKNSAYELRCFPTKKLREGTQLHHTSSGYYWSPPRSQIR